MLMPKMAMLVFWVKIRSRLCGFSPDLSEGEHILDEIMWPQERHVRQIPEEKLCFTHPNL